MSLADTQRPVGRGPLGEQAVQEQAFTVDCEGDTMVAVLHTPTQPTAGADALGFVIVVGGPQYRAGSHRHFVTFARDLARAGYPALRFDARGMGDSTGELRSFEHISADIGSAVDALLKRQPQLRHVALWGLCDGASAAMLYLQQRRDPRVSALCLVNPWVRSEASQARTQVKHYYRDRLRQPEFWRKLLSGKVAWTAVSGLARNVKTAFAAPDRHKTIGGQGSYQDRMLAGWQWFKRPTLLLLSGNDYTAKEFVEYAKSRPAWQHVLTSRSVEQLALAEADHTFSDAAAKHWVFEVTSAWLARNAGIRSQPEQP